MLQLFHSNNSILFVLHEDFLIRQHSNDVPFILIGESTSVCCVLCCCWLIQMQISSETQTETAYVSHLSLPTPSSVPMPMESRRRRRRREKRNCAVPSRKFLSWILENAICVRCVCSGWWLRRVYDTTGDMRSCCSTSCVVQFGRIKRCTFTQNGR